MWGNDLVWSGGLTGSGRVCGEEGFPRAWRGGQAASRVPPAWPRRGAALSRLLPCTPVGAWPGLRCGLRAASPVASGGKTLWS